MGISDWSSDVCSSDLTAEEQRLEARDLAEALDLPIGNAVDFWTAASLFSAAGLTAIVYGPGDIPPPHTADEWVALEQLQRSGASVARKIGKKSCRERVCQYVYISVVAVS